MFDLKEDISRLIRHILYAIFLWTLFIFLIFNYKTHIIFLIKNIVLLKYILYILMISYLFLLVILFLWIFWNFNKALESYKKENNLSVEDVKNILPNVLKKEIDERINNKDIYILNIIDLITLILGGIILLLFWYIIFF